MAFDVEQMVAAFDNAGTDNDIKELITSQFSEGFGSMTEFQHEDATSTAIAVREVDGKLSQMSEEQGNNSGLWRTRYALEDELKLHEVSECDGERLTPTQVRALDALMNGASQAEAAGKSARWLWTQLNEGGEFLNAYRHAVQSLQKQSQLTALQRARDVMDVVTSITITGPRRVIVPQKNA